MNLPNLPRLSLVSPIDNSTKWFGGHRNSPRQGAISTMLVVGGCTLVYQVGKRIVLAIMSSAKAPEATPAPQAIYVDASGATVIPVAAAPAPVAAAPEAVAAAPVQTPAS